MDFIPPWEQQQLEEPVRSWTSDLHRDSHFYRAATAQQCHRREMLGSICHTGTSTYVFCSALLQIAAVLAMTCVSSALML